MAHMCCCKAVSFFRPYCSPKDDCTDHGQHCSLMYCLGTAWQERMNLLWFMHAAASASDMSSCSYLE